jgi:hypothetical protein
VLREEPAIKYLRCSTVENSGRRSNGSPCPHYGVRLIPEIQNGPNSGSICVQFFKFSCFRSMHHQLLMICDLELIPFGLDVIYTKSNVRDIRIMTDIAV